MLVVAAFLGGMRFERERQVRKERAAAAAAAAIDAAIRLRMAGSGTLVQPGRRNSTAAGAGNTGIAHYRITSALGSAATERLECQVTVYR